MLNAGYREAIGGAVSGLPSETGSAARGSIAAATAVAAGQPDGGPLLAAARDAFVSGMERSMVAGAVIILVAAIATFLLAPGRGTVGARRKPDVIPAVE